MLFTTPFFIASVIFSFVYIFGGYGTRETEARPLPNYPDPCLRHDLYLVVGELHHPKRPVPVERPRWLIIPDRGLFTGIVVLEPLAVGRRLDARTHSRIRCWGIGHKMSSAVPQPSCSK